MKQTVVITGASRGIGRAVALAFAEKSASKNNQEEYNIFVNCAKNSELLENVKKQIRDLGVCCESFTGDISDYNTAMEMFDEVHRHFGNVDILVNNAGISIIGLFQDMTRDEWDRIMNVNVGSVYNCCHFAIPDMINTKSGRIINISSTNGMNTYYPMSIDYDVSKAALNALTHDLAMQWGPYIHVNAIAPGFIGTESELDGYDEEFLKQECEKILVERYGKPEEVAYLVKFLISEEADYINNTIIRIDGGQKGSC